MVVPSKFFGALAAGRPVLFVGSADSSLARWIQEFEIGWVLTSENLHQVKGQLLLYMESTEKIAAMQQRCFRVYQQFFSRTTQIQKFDQSLRSLLSL
jgi:hypothetical protein